MYHEHGRSPIFYNFDEENLMKSVVLLCFAAGLSMLALQPMAQIVPVPASPSTPAMQVGGSSFIRDEKKSISKKIQESTAKTRGRVEYC